MDKNSDHNRLTVRTTRLGIVVILFGAVWYLFKGSLNIWYRTFSENLALKFFLDIGSILSVSLLACAVLIMLSILQYVFFELQTFKYFEIDTEEQKVLKKAEVSFIRIFESTKRCFHVMIASLVIICIIEASKNPLSESIYIYLFLVLSLIFLLLVFIKEKVLPLRNQKLTKFKKIALFFELIMSSIINQFWGVIKTLVILIFLGILVSIISLDKKGYLEIELKETTNIPLKFNMQNNTDPNIYININNDTSSNVNISKQIKTNELDKSSLEIMEVDNTKIFDKKNKQIKEGSWEHVEIFSLKESNYYYKYTTELKKYMVEGRNVVKIIVLPSGTSGKQRIVVTTTINKQGDIIRIAKKKFKIKL